MHFFTNGAARYAQFERLRHTAGLVHAFATRPDDVSARSDALAPQRAARRARMASDLGFDPARLAWCVQVHDTRLAILDETAVCGPLEGFDAVLTNRLATPLMTFSADCPLLLLYDPENRAIGLAHASWRCTLARIAALLVERMTRVFGSDPGALLAGVGPSAGPCCYEVQEDVRAAAAELPNHVELFPRRDGRMYFDLWEANRRELTASGVPHSQIELAQVCTMCRTDVFYSFRREGAGCGHFGLLAGIASAR